MKADIRRVVTGHDPHGRSIVLSDSTPPSYKSPSGHHRTEVWSSDATPAKIGDGADPDKRAHPLTPPDSGTAFKIVDFPPENNVSGGDETLGSHTTAKPGAHPGMHRTQTLDYCLVVDGEIHLILDGSETLMRTGDIAIQAGTNHAWSNRSSRPCRMAFFMVDGRFEPKLADTLRDLASVSRNS
jgi:quercetin dioxygenase-like cupin family protein